MTGLCLWVKKCRETRYRDYTSIKRRRDWKLKTAIFAGKSENPNQIIQLGLHLSSRQVLKWNWVASCWDLRQLVFWQAYVENHRTVFLNHATIHIAL